MTIMGLRPAGAASCTAPARTAANTVWAMSPPTRVAGPAKATLAPGSAATHKASVAVPVAGPSALVAAMPAAARACALASIAVCARRRGRRLRGVDEHEQVDRARGEGPRPRARGGERVADADGGDGLGRAVPA